MLSWYDDLKHTRVPEIRLFLLHKLNKTHMPSHQAVLFPSFRELWPLFLSGNQNLHVLEGWVVSYLCLKCHLVLWYGLSWKHTHADKSYNTHKKSVHFVYNIFKIVQKSESNSNKSVTMSVQLQLMNTDEMIN